MQDQWSPNFTFDKIIYSVLSLLDDPNVDSYINEEAVELYNDNKESYEKTIRYWTSEFANLKTVQNELKKLDFQMEFS